MLKWIFTVITLPAFTFLLSAQQPLNLDFEQLSVEGTSRPWGWNADVFENVQMTLDSAVTHAGKYSLRIDGRTNGAFSLSYDIEPYMLKNKNIVVKGWAKGNCKAYCRIKYTSNFSQASERTVESDSATVSGIDTWQPVYLTMTVPQNTDLVKIVLECMGNDTIWFDDFSLLINGKKYEAVRIAPSFSKKEQAWLSRHTVPVSSTAPWKPEKPSATMTRESSKKWPATRLLSRWANRPTAPASFL